MQEDWRVELTVDHGGALQRMHERRLAHDVREQIAPLVVTVDGPKMFAYADSESVAREAAALLEKLAQQHGLTVHTSILRWHPDAEAWAPADAPLPATPAERAAERAQRDAREDADSSAWGYLEWEVRIEVAAKDQAKQLGERLEARGLPVRWHKRHVLVGARDEDEAAALAERLRPEVPEGATIVAQGSEAYAWAEMRHLGRPR